METVDRDAQPTPQFEGQSKREISASKSSVGRGEVELPTSRGVSAVNSAATTRLEIRDKQQTPPDTALQYNVQLYLDRCKRPPIPLAPLRRVMTQLNSASLELQFMNLGPRHVQAICKALKHNATVETVDLRSNGVDSATAANLADLIRNNPCIRTLNLSENATSGAGCVNLGETLASNSGLVELDLSDNNLTDSDAKALANGLCKNYQLLRLRLGRNSIEVDGSKQLARMLIENDTLEELDLSWNHIRGKGGIALARSLKVNTGLVSLDLSWNGLGYEGCIALEEAISFNRYLRELDVTANRINWEGAQLIAKGLKKNAALTVLKIGLNTLTMTGVMDILRAVDSDSSAVRHIDFEGQIISSKILFKIETIGRRRPFTCRHESVIDSEDVLGTRIEAKEDPLRLLFDFLSSRAIRIVDLYRMIDKDNKQFCSRSKFIRSLKRMKVPLTEMELLRVTQRIDPKKTGKISYQMLAKGLRSLRVQLRDDEKKRAAQERREQADQKRLLDQVGELSLDAAAQEAAAAAKRRRSMAARALDNSLRSEFAPTPLGITERMFRSPSPLSGGSAAAYYFLSNDASRQQQHQQRKHQPDGKTPTSAMDSSRTGGSRPVSLPPISAGSSSIKSANNSKTTSKKRSKKARRSTVAGALAAYKRPTDVEGEDEDETAEANKDYKAPTAVTFTE